MVDKLPTPAVHTAARRLSLGVAAYVAAIVLSASLLFSVQPLFTKMVLPRFGGSAMVWSVATVFFQFALLIGYAYAHALTRWFDQRAAAAVHLSLLAAGGLFLPLAPAAGFGDGDETFALIGLFLVSLGLPFAALSANAPLLQAWFARSGLPGSDNPYPLYAASNAGSLGALLAYPFLIEPFSRLGTQTFGWSLGYAALFGLILLLAVTGRGGASDRQARRAAQPLPAKLIGWCVFLGLVPSGALVAVTAHLSTDVAAAPFLWVLPLALYLATFIIAFGSRSLNFVEPLGRALPFLLAVLVAQLAFEIRLPTLAEAMLHMGVFFALALYCHSRLATMRPGADNLTGFYLAMSAGGVLGGIFAAILAPRLFSFVAEYPILLALAALALPRRGAQIGALLALVLVAGRVFPLDSRDRETHRSFFGVHTIETTRDGQFRTLRHGVEVHGAQRIADAAGQPVRGLPAPLTYYHEEGPISEAIDAVREKIGSRPMRLGVVGLGAGSIACLAERTDQMTFFEIDPLVARIARDMGRFSFLSSCAPQARIVIGDARLTLAEGAEPFDLIIVDAFSSDSIPAHLLTREALAIFMKRLTQDGVLLMHISNNHLRLNEVVAATARSLGLFVRINDEETPDDAPTMFIQPTVAAIARTEADFGELAESDEWLSPSGALPEPWTDDYSNLLGALISRVRSR